MPAVISRHGNAVVKLKRRSLGGYKSAKVKVGYEAPYAIYVHENLYAQHPNGGQAKYLEEPSRTKTRQMREVLVLEMKTRKRPLADAIFKMSLYLLTESRKLVPVDTGYLKASGFVEAPNGSRVSPPAGGAA